MKRQKLAALIAWKEKANRKPLVLNGARQVGKTFLLRQFASAHFTTTHYLNFEEQPSLARIFDGDLDPATLIRDIALAIGKPINSASDLIIFDEIQACPRALTSLKYFAESSPWAYICAAGSLLGVALTESPFPVGKVESIAIQPLSFSEFLIALERNDLDEIIADSNALKSISPAVHQRIWNYLRAFITTGGLPEVINTYRENPSQGFFAARKLQLEILANYERDIAKHAGRINSMHIIRTFSAVGAQVSKSIDGSVQRFRFRNVLPGANKYERLAGPLDWLLQAGLIYKVPLVEHPQLPLIAHTQENIFKLYVFDTGLLGAMTNLSPEAMFEFSIDGYKGVLAENFVLQELHAAGLSSVFGWQQREAEIEFLAHGHTEAIPIEVKSAARYRARSFESYVKRYQPTRGYILSAKAPTRDAASAILQQPLYRAFYFGQELARWGSAESAGLVSADTP